MEHARIVMRDKGSLCAVIEFCDGCFLPDKSRGASRNKKTQRSGFYEKTISEDLKHKIRNLLLVRAKSCIDAMEAGAAQNATDFNTK
jgi:hypothetical protein